ncbi:hypothetical protein KIH07_11530 [Hydrogenophaga taeniospiralis]|jgi:hypothetical protein|uniref:hypothetical protein n=1 Tax=Hydrogenophaga taeniospiralis TaxID=65656 RepID=UPI0008AFF044|nr:hypothetical protein [Hydrogenophaga taeniospiralis]OGB17720.1 MAG: hypothetical protein A3I64_12650 [Burkholderiales bacterium RIFCSPLOWO2_02_FULL_67_64]OGB43303.1 MAG: hypothetical protein A3E51_22330 [Burkholderiales bacterium RIFCSPHIGHO2_12_FULL_67_38]OGB43588.1 MAG: hypothetical protein A2W72_00160 [Burkholderiales bacterium RIFCSPLOWO2_12_67_14]OGB76312.1 MAG: hypothetical protein A3G82_06215 [Burkholderiales bacterium RIFCSPLOWO2_12_FULL_67_210]MCB4364369.1 hypothetical protein [Hyd
MSTTTLSLRLASVLATASLLAACASTTPQLDAAFGDAVREARAAQTLNPKASENTDPVLGIDGKAGAAAQQRYQESFQAPPKTFEIINIGGTITGN